MQIHQFLADRIRESGRKQNELSQAAGVSQSAISSILTGVRTNLRADVVARLGAALELSPTALGRAMYASFNHGENHEKAS